MNVRNITPADERIELALVDLENIANRLNQLCIAMQKNGSGLWGDCSQIKMSVDDAVNLLENGY
jgi:hypothetical protein